MKARRLSCCGLCYLQETQNTRGRVFNAGPISTSMTVYDLKGAREDDSDDAHFPEQSLSASVPEESSPLRNGAVRPNIARQRSSSTQISRPKLPAWQQEGSVRRMNMPTTDADDVEPWNRSHSSSPPPRLSLEGGYSSRSSASPAQHSSAATSPDPELPGRKSFKRSITVPTRPKIPGTWADASTAREPETMAESDVSLSWACNVSTFFCQSGSLILVVI